MRFSGLSISTMCVITRFHLATSVCKAPGHGNLRTSNPKSPIDDVKMIVPGQEIPLNSSVEALEPVPLNYVADQGKNESAFPLGLCEGDCDDDNDCQGELECFQRGRGGPIPPGCTGQAVTGRDYCHDPKGSLRSVTASPTPVDTNTSPPTMPPTPTTSWPTSLPTTSIPTSPPTVAPTPTATPADVSLNYVADQGKNEGAFPLGLCEGDCDDDNDCQGELECFQRGRGGPIPQGCTGQAVTGRDYCHDPKGSLETRTTASPTPADTNSPPLTLPPTPPTSFPTSPPTTSIPTSPPTVAPTPTATPTDVPLNYVADQGKNEGAFPLGLCEGDCDDDKDCQGDLQCFQRGRGGPIPPGCTGEAVSGRDYCHDPTGSLKFPNSPTGSSTPGDSYTPQPTLPPTPTPTQPPNYQPELEYVGDNKDWGGDNKDEHLFPLAQCQGDCDGHDECDGTSTRCWQRDDGDVEPIPGCSGTPSGNTDYCYDIYDSAVDPSALVFRLRLYWNSSYFWQETTDETFWCMECHGGSCSFNDTIHVKDCDRDNTLFEFVDTPGVRGSLIKVHGQEFCLAVVNHRGRTSLRHCDPTANNQRWEAGLGALNESRFDLRPVTMDSYCLTQHHHPKDGEDVGATNCAKAHRHETGYWNKF